MTPADKVDSDTFEALRDRVRGVILEPGDEGYNEARQVWNARIDREPAAILQCRGAADVVAGVRFARRNEIPLSVKGGGHHVSGAAVRNDGLTIDLGPMDAIRIDPGTSTVRVQAGATWGQVDHETQAFGLATPGGQDPNIGVAGLTLGGGVGWLSRKHGLACDNLRSADLVTAEGDLVAASAKNHPDLFWALRGGGGNFGVVTTFEFELHEVGPEVFAGSLLYPFEDASAVARRYREFMAEAPREVRLLYGVMACPPASSFPSRWHGSRVAMLVAFHAGPADAGRRAFSELRSFGDPIADTLGERRYEAFQRAGQSKGRMRTHVRSQYLPTLSDAAIETIVEQASDVPSGDATVFVSPRGGAETEPAPDATAYPHREPGHHVLVEARWADPTRDREHIDWTGAFHEALRPYTTGAAAMNFLTDDEGRDRIDAAYGENLARLVRLKREWDPQNVFDANQNIDPAW